MPFGPIVLIEDDSDDQEMLQNMLDELGITLPLVAFDVPEDAINFLLTTDKKPFLILCDVNLPRMNGIEFKKELDANPELHKKSIPFIFYTTSSNQDTVNDAFTELSVQGYFQKGITVDELRKTVSVIFAYWMLCKHPER